MILTDGGTTAEWLTGIVVAVTPGTPTPYDVRLNANGMVLQRISPARLALIGTAGRIAPLTDLP